MGKAVGKFCPRLGMGTALRTAGKGCERIDAAWKKTEDTTMSQHRSRREAHGDKQTRDLRTDGGSVISASDVVNGGTTPGHDERQGEFAAARLMSTGSCLAKCARKCYVKAFCKPYPLYTDVMLG